MTERRSYIRNYMKTYRQNNRDRVNEIARRAYQRNKEKIKIRNKVYYEKNKERLLMKSHEYYRENREEQRKQAKERYERNKERLLQKSSEWYFNNREICKLNHKKWVMLNRDKTNHKNRRYKARKRGASGSHTLEEWENLKRKYGWRCLMCNRLEPEIKLVEDHILPLSKGGSDDIDNIQPLCKNCNNKKYIKKTDYRGLEVEGWEMWGYDTQ